MINAINTTIHYFKSLLKYNILIILLCLQFIFDYANPIIKQCYVQLWFFMIGKVKKKLVKIILLYS